MAGTSGFQVRGAQVHLKPDQYISGYEFCSLYCQLSEIFQPVFNSHLAIEMTKDKCHGWECVRLAPPTPALLPWDDLSRAGQANLTGAVEGGPEPR